WVVAALASRDATELEPMGSLDEDAQVIRPRLDALNRAFSESEYPNLGRNSPRKRNQSAFVLVSLSGNSTRPCMAAARRNRDSHSVNSRDQRRHLARVPFELGAKGLAQQTLFTSNADVGPSNE